MQLAKAGAEVTVFEKKEPASGATRASVAWINPVVDDTHYMRIRLESMKAWYEDDLEYGMNAIWGGSLNWAYANNPKNLEKFKKRASLMEEVGNPPRYLTAEEITQISPGVFPGDNVAFAFQSTKDGHVDPVFATQRYLNIAKVYGAKVLYPCEVTDVVVKKSTLRSVRTTMGDFELDYLVSATGTDTPHVMSLIDRKLELLHKPGLVIHTTPRPFETNKVYEAGGIIEFKQYYDGRFLSSFTAGPPDIPVHAEIRSRQMDYPDDDLRQFHADMLLSRTAEMLPSIAEASVDKVIVGFRPYPLDNRPVCGFVPGVNGVYVVVTHSGVTLAPILGRYTAAEILTGAEMPMLQPYRPSRYIGN